PDLPELATALLDSLPKESDGATGTDLLLERLNLLSWRDGELAYEEMFRSAAVLLASENWAEVTQIGEIAAELRPETERGQRAQRDFAGLVEWPSSHASRDNVVEILRRYQ